MPILPAIPINNRRDFYLAAATAPKIDNVNRGCPQSQRSGLGRDSEAMEGFDTPNIAN